MMLASVMWLVACSGDASDGSPLDSAAPNPTDTGEPDPTTPEPSEPWCVTYEVSDGSSVVTERGSRRVDERERVVLEERDLGADGTIASRVTTSYDDVAGTLTRVYEGDLDDDGVLEDRTEELINIVNEITVTSERDLDADGELDVTLTTVEATPEGDPVEQVFVDLETVERRHRAFDGQRREVLFERDFGDDGTVDQRVTSTHDDARRTTVRSSDFDVDGTPDAIVSIERDADGRVVRSQTDTPVGGPLEFVELFTYDPDGRLVTRVQEVGRYSTTWTHTYDADGRPLAVTSTNGFSTAFTVVDCP